MTAESETLIALTADIVAAHVSNNNVATGDVAALIQNVFGAMQKLGTPDVSAEPEKPKGAVSVRASIKPDHLISMIDGKPYKMLKRHLGQNGYTPESYRTTFGLPTDYPMVAPSYSATRKALAHKIGLGRKPKAEAAPAVEAVPEPAPKAVSKPRVKKSPLDAAKAHLQANDPSGEGKKARF